MNCVLDASAILAYLKGEPGAAVVSDAIGKGAAVSAINWAEVLSKLAEAGAPPNEVTTTLTEKGILGRGIVVCVADEALACEMAQLYPQTRRKGISLGDRACLALARSLNLPALTADSKWGSLALGAEVRQIR